ncbi:hypothetical protein FisN_14Hh020 [Fistulifera solaris]|uniref:Uncharacterized protein n=1 Tax=Fistulifera solaris TaxID=1519565 RepID=A0A1Z5K846_FISSO|nr:hypothetical protein FisN_14Hh020 [Fistulifera solaris]|eukprot:GAX22407.1 hypothetical protein FisN_14Hh020 [Fistulifera solaris]
MKIASASILLTLSTVSHALEHPVAQAQLEPAQLDHLHDLYNSFQELQQGVQSSHHRDLALGDGALALGDALLCRFQLASCQTLTAAANVEAWADSLQPMQNSTTMGPLLTILNLATDVAESLAELAGLGTLNMVLDSADSVLKILSELLGNLRNFRGSSFDTLSAMESIDVVVHETGMAFQSLGMVWANFWASVTVAWTEAKGIMTEAYAISETMFITMYRDVIKASANFLMTFWTTTIEYVTTAGSQQKMACATGRIECSYEMWSYEMFPSLATLSLIGGNQPDSVANKPNVTKPEPVSNATLATNATLPVVNATESEPLTNATQPEA